MTAVFRIRRRFFTVSSPLRYLWMDYASRRVHLTRGGWVAMSNSTPIAWLESPLQLIGAAEWAAANRLAVPVAGRLTAQMSQTADELVAREAWFGRMDPYLGIPWQLLSKHRHWLVGDGFSGQFRLAAGVLRPRRVTFLDDGANVVAFADALLGRLPFARPGVTERGLTTTLAPFAGEVILRRAQSGDADFFTAFDLGAERVDALRDRGFAVRQHDFEWTRSTAGRRPALRERIVLGSARPVDGRMSLPAYLSWLAGVVRPGAVSYLPHRRETPAQLAAVAAVPGVDVVATGLPVELVLAGIAGPLDIRTLPSSAVTTLALVVGEGVSVNGRPIAAVGTDPAEAEGARA